MNGESSMMHETYQVPAIDRALNALELLVESNKPITIKEISAQLDIPIASCFRIIKTLQTRGYIMESDEAPGLYAVGFKILHLADQALHKLDLRGIAISPMREVSTLTNQAVQLGKLDAKGVVYIEQVLPLRPVNVIAALHTPLSINISAAGKVLCAYMPLYQQSAYLEQVPFEGRTEHSVMDKAVFQQQLKTIRDRQYALDIEEYNLGIGCIAVPIFDYTGQCVATLGITGDIGDYSSQGNRDRMLSILQNAAASISLRLGYGT